MQRFTANLSAILTVNRLEFEFSDDYYVGYNEGSFMKQFLTKRLRVKESRLIAYGSLEKFNDTMSKGSKNRGIDAIFDEIPYMNYYSSTAINPVTKSSDPLTGLTARALCNTWRKPSLSY
ncbi:hypothetical protein ABFS83_10G136400 [Erythranthe nasuta]